MRWAVSGGSFVCSYSHFPWLVLLPEFSLLLDQLWHYIFIGVQTLLWIVHAEDLGFMLLMRIQPEAIPYPATHRKIIFYTTRSRGQNIQGLLSYRTVLLPVPRNQAKLAHQRLWCKIHKAAGRTVPFQKYGAFLDLSLCTGKLLFAWWICITTAALQWQWSWKLDSTDLIPFVVWKVISGSLPLSRMTFPELLVVAHCLEKLRELLTPG